MAGECQTYLALHITENICLIYHVIYVNVKEPKLQLRTIHTQVQVTFVCRYGRPGPPSTFSPIFPFIWKLNLAASAQYSSGQEPINKVY